VEVAAFSRAIGLDAEVGQELSSPFNTYGGVNRAGATFFLFDLLNSMIDSVFGLFHKQKARKLCRQLLREAPNSLICASCLFVYRRN
jgi:hypothetical protein